jgi:transglutaminase-like putative cysteine protease/tetratricopeptide (TPR) repeat protein
MLRDRAESLCDFIIFCLLALASSGSISLLAFAQNLPPSSSIPSATAKSNGEEAAVIERILNRVRFENDGTEISETEAVVRIQSQAGVEEFGQLVFGYSSATEKLKIEYVRVRKPDGHVVETPESTAQDFAPDVLREAPMYSDYRQRHISVAALQPGDVLEYRTVTRVETPLAAGNFWYEYTFPKDVVVEDDRLEINIPKGRELKLKTPNRKPEIQDSGDRRTYIWIEKNIHPEPEQSASEEEPSRPDIQLTTFTDWKQVAQWYAKLQGERMTVDDSVKKRADELTKGADTPEEKARRLYDFVARNIRYVSISLGVGRYQPHSASDVMQNGYGDCKDKHTLLAALLKAEGIQSYPVLIDSSRRLDPDVPSPAQFDHVITAIRLGTKLIWVDTTPEVTPFGLILYQLRNKEAVLASDESDGGLQRTPANSPVATFLHFSLNGTLSASGALEGTVDVTAQGDRDWPMRRNFRQMSSGQWKSYVKVLSESWGLAGDVDDVALDAIEDTGKPFHLKYRLRQEHYFQVPSVGINFRPMPRLAVPPAKESEHSSPNQGSPNHGSPNDDARLDIGPPAETDYHVRLQFPSTYTLRVPTPVKMTRDYGAYSSSYSVSKDIMEGERRLVINTNEIPAARRADYESFSNAAQSDQDQVLSCTIAAPASHATEATKVKLEGTPAELQKAGRRDLQARNYFSAIDLLKRATDGDGSLKGAWNELGQAYAGASDHEKAIAAFRQQLKVDPNHKSANAELSLELQLSGQNEDAVSAYRKQLAISPYEKITHRNLGLLLAQLHRDADARVELEAAAAMPPEDPETKLALAQVSARLGDNSKAEELMRPLIGSFNSNALGDLYALALRIDTDPAQAENDAQEVLYEIGAQFDAGEFERPGPAISSAMQLVALSWARIGWARFHRDENLPAVQFLTAAWLLSQSGVVADRLAQVFEKQGQAAKAAHFYALALSAGESDEEAKNSRAHFTKLATDPAQIEKDIEKARDELVQSRTLKVEGLAEKTGEARFTLVFDSSPRPERVDFAGGDEKLRSGSASLREKEFPVRFPDVSSVKIVRQAKLQCRTGCTIELLPIDK